MGKKALLTFSIALSLFFLGSSFVRQSIAALRSTDNFIIHTNDSRVLFEPGAEEYAAKIGGFFDSAIQLIEAKQYSSFTDPVRAYVCSSRESFKKYFGADVRAGVLIKLFLSPRVFDDGNYVAELYLTHELSHLHIRDKIGNYKMSRLPVWFKEGLATYVSGGGGAHTVSDKEAVDAIISGKHFIPNKRGGLIFQKTASDWGLKHHMFYRQSMIFIKYLAETNEGSFQKMLLAVESGERFHKSLEAAYNKKLETLWNEFLDDIEGFG